MVEAKISMYMAVCSDRGPRKFNQDCAFAGSLKNANGTDVWVVCVADGVGGGQHGEQAATLAVNSLCSLVRNSAFSDVTALKALIPKWLTGLNGAVKEIAGADDSVNTTLSACLVSHGRSLLVHVGDSRIYVVDENSCRPITVDHNDANEALKQGVDEEFVGKTDFRALSRSLGSGIEEVEPDIHMDILKPGQSCWIVATSDGVHDKVPSATIMQLARAARSAEELASDLVKWALKSGTKDNATAAILRIGKIMPTGRKPAFDSASLNMAKGVRNGFGHEEGLNMLTGRPVSNGALIATAMLLICLASPLLWYAFFVRGKGGPGGIDTSRKPPGTETKQPPNAKNATTNYINAPNLVQDERDSPQGGPSTQTNAATQSDAAASNGLMRVTVKAEKNWTWLKLASHTTEKLQGIGYKGKIDYKDLIKALPQDEVGKRKKARDKTPYLLENECFEVVYNKNDGKIKDIKHKGSQIRHQVLSDGESKSNLQHVSRRIVHASRMRVSSYWSAQPG